MDFEVKIKSNRSSWLFHMIERLYASCIIDGDIKRNRRLSFGSFLQTLVETKVNYIPIVEHSSIQVN